MYIELTIVEDNTIILTDKTFFILFGIYQHFLIRFRSLPLRVNLFIHPPWRT